MNRLHLFDFPMEYAMLLLKYFNQIKIKPKLFTKSQLIDLKTMTCI